MNFFDNYFVFSNSEKKGIFIFVCILFLMTLFYMVMPYVYISKSFDFTEFEKELEAKKSVKNEKVELFKFNPNSISKDSLLVLGFTQKQSNNIINYRTKIGKFKSEKDFRKIYSISDSLVNEIQPYLIFDENNKEYEKEKAVVEDSLFVFDPNRISYNQLLALGMSQKQAQTVINYRNKGGVFYKKEDFKKVYSVTDELYDKLESYIQIEIINPEKTIQNKVISLIELNTANKEQLKKIKGIGETMSTRIIKFRDKLGGFYSLTQLDEVFGLDSTIKLNKTQYFIVDVNALTKLNINKLEFKDLLSHPYIDYSTTKKIINYREMHGDFTSVEQILENNLIKAEQYRKIVSYIVLK